MATIETLQITADQLAVGDEFTIVKGTTAVVTRIGAGTPKTIDMTFRYLTCGFQDSRVGMLWSLAKRRSTKMTVRRAS